MGLRMLREQASGLTREQRNAFLAAWLGWAMDAFDYFLLVFVITDVAKDFGTTKTHVAVATTLTLAARPVGARRCWSAWCSTRRSSSRPASRPR
jgi:MFS transporter, SHS family, lactate transporter